MAGVEQVEKIVPNTEEKTAATTEPTPKETVHTDDSANAVEVEIKEEEAPKIEKTETVPVKEEKPVAVEKKDADAPAAEKDKAVQDKTV